MAKECEQWIENYHALQSQLTDATQEALQNFLGLLHKK
jgi:hypothetical protein